MRFPDALPIHLEPGSTVEAGLELAVKEAQRVASGADRLMDAVSSTLPGELARQLTPMVNLVLYLCAQNSELRDAAGHRERPANPHARPRAHIRRAHWSTYWTGPKTAPQTPALRWLAPIPVNVDEAHGVVPTVRRAGEEP